MDSNSTNIIDKSYFESLTKLDPDDLCQKALCRYDKEKKSYTILVWGNEYTIFPQELKIECSDGKFNPHELFYLFVIFYLLNLKDVKVKNEWISEKDIPGGTTFFRGPHEIPTDLISKRYKNDLKAFSEKCIELGGIELDFADAAYRFDIVPHIPIAALYWEGDDDFPPEAKILYDRTIMDHLTSDIIFSLAVQVCARIGEV